MLNIKDLPLRQKILLTVAIPGGVILMIWSLLNASTNQWLNSAITFYCVILMLATSFSDALVDLNDPKIFKIWYLVGIVLFAISLINEGNGKFLIERSEEFYDQELNHYQNKFSTSGLRGLLYFLTLYWPINKLFNLKKISVINAYRRTWYHDVARRRIRWFDFLLSAFLLAFGMICMLYW